MSEDSVIRLVDIRYTTSGADEAAAANKRLSGSLEDVGVKSDQTSRAILSTEKSYDTLQRRVDTAYRAQQQQTQSLKTLDAARSQGLVTDARYAELQGLIAQQYNTTVSRAGEAGKAIAGFAQQSGLARYELINLSRQAQDVAVSLGSGQSFGTVLLQQGTQIADVFANSQGTVKGFFSQVVSGAASVLTPMRLITGAVTAIGAAALYVANNWDQARGEIDRSLIGVGARTGTTATDIGNFAKANSSAFGLSIAEARNAAQEFTKSGEVSIKSLSGIGQAIHGYAILTGKDATEATKVFADALGGDLVKGLQGIDQRYGVLNASTLAYIRNLVDAGDKTKAFQVYVDATADANRRAEQTVSGLSKAWQLFKNISVPGPPVPATLEEQIAALQQRRDQAAATPTVGTSASTADAVATAMGSVGKAAEIAELDRQIEKLKQDLADFDSRKATAEIDKVSNAAKAATDAIFPQINTISQLNQAIRNIDAARAAGNAPENADAARAALQQQVNLQQQAMEASIRQTAITQQLQANWGGVSAQVALSLTNLESQATIANAITGEEHIQ